MIKWCKYCVLPSTRPNLKIDSKGICNACNQSKTKKIINWIDREKQFAELVKKIKKKKKYL